jgi:hypothetical protein
MINILPMGYDCSSASVLGHLGLRTISYPFDWIVSSTNSLRQCFSENFRRFHKDLRYNHDKKGLIDEYGFTFFHDYPIETNGCIVDNWKDYYDNNVSKYERRIKRFIELMKSDTPILVLCRRNKHEVLHLQELFLNYYNKNNIYIISASTESFENDKIKNIYPEIHGNWNDVTIWKTHVDDFLLKHNYTPIIHNK